MESTERIRVGVIGAGLRATIFFSHIPPELKDRVLLTALADPSEEHRNAFASCCGTGAPPRHYESGAEMLAHEELDALIIASPNYAHAADAILAIERRIPLLLEKPVATTVEDCAKLWRAYRAAGEPPVTVGFAVRYTPFYTRVRAMVQEGLVGQLLSVDADEHIGPAVTRLFFGGWRRWDEKSGGFMVEKCSHDFDLLRMITGSEAVRVFSTARRTHFLPRPVEERLPRFDREEAQDEALDYSDTATYWAFNTTLRQSLYETGGDLPDHQSVLIEWESGVLSCFTANFSQPRTTRAIRVSGVNGTLRGDIGRSQLVLEAAGETENTMQREEFEIAHDDSGHHGGDASISAEFWRSCVGEGAPATQTRAGVREGIEAALIALAAHRSAQTGLPENVAELRRQVFGEG